MTATRNYFAQSWPDENPSFRRRWSEPAPRNENRRPGWTPEAAAKSQSQHGRQLMDTTTWTRLSIAVLTDSRKGRAAA